MGRRWAAGRNDVLLDSSALIEVSQKSATRQAFVRCVESAAVAVLIPPGSLDESFSSRDHSKNQATAAGMAELLSVLGPRVRLMPVVSEIWRREARGRLNRAPELPDDARIALQKELARAAMDPAVAVDWFGEVRTVVTDWKREREASNRKASREMRAQMRKSPMALAGMKAEMKQLSPLALPDWIVTSLLRDVIGAHPRTVARVVAKHRRSPSLKVWAALAWLTMAGDAVPDGYGNDDEFFKMLEPHRNNFYDASIGAFAAYAGFLVSEDHKFRRRCNFLRNRGLVPFRAVKLERLGEFIGA